MTEGDAHMLWPDVNAMREPGRGKILCGSSPANMHGYWLAAPFCGRSGMIQKLPGEFLDVAEELETPFDLLDMCLILAIHAHLILN